MQTVRLQLLHSVIVVCIITISIMADIRKVRRCLFGRPTDSEHDSFKKWVAEENLQSAAKFERDWNYDVVTGMPDAGAIDWCPGTADIPSVYTKGYVHKCRQRPAMLPVDSVQNSNQCCLGSSDDSSSQDSVCTADVWIGRVQETTPRLEERTKPSVPPSSVSTISTKSFEYKRRQKQQTQRRLLDCDRWSVRKNKRSRSLTPETESSSKRQRLDS